MTVAAVYAQGEMGAGVAGRLSERGARVLTVLEGRSEASRRRAAAAHMEEASSFEALAEADVFLSIVPPGQARSLAEALGARWRGRAKTPLFVDCNAVSPETAVAIGGALARAGVAYVDAGIIGGPPRPGQAGPKVYACGAEAPRFAKLGDFGLTIEILDAPIGAASALKMAYGGVTKGMTAIGAMMALAAQRAGAGEALKRELAASQPSMSPWLTRQCLTMIPKAYRWVAEMQEVAEFQGPDAQSAQTFRAIADFYQRLAADESAQRRESDGLRGFFAKEGQGRD